MPEQPPRPKVSPPAAATSCPVCNAAVPHSSLVAHVNRCLDATSALPASNDIASPDDTDIPSPPPSPPPSMPSSSASNPAASPGDIAKPRQEILLATWLSSLGLPKYAAGFLRAGYRSLADLIASPPLPDKTLRDTCGVAAMGARKKISSELAILARRNVPAAAKALTETQPKDEIDEKPKRKVWAIFEPGYRASSSSPRKRPRSNTAIGGTAGNGGSSASRGGQRGPRKHWFSHRVPGTSFTVDSFYAAPNDPEGSKYFLSHFHSDHYGGLRKKTLPKGSRVLCSAVTSSLVHSQLRVPKESIQVLPLGKKVDIPEPTNPSHGVSVWLYDANHCPGAVVFLFHVWQTKRYVLHTGDCRFDPAVFNRHEKLVGVVREGHLDYMHLDTTYCNPQHVFPHQASVLEQVVSAAREEDKRTKGQCLYFFGTYSIGKEKVFLAVAEALNLKIFTGKRKRGILEQCGFGSRLTDRLVSSAGDARVQVVSMRALSADGLREYAVRNKLNTSFIGRGLAIAFKPTGWTFRGDPTKPRRVNRSVDQAMLYEVAYSEHSSYEELVAFVKWSKAARIIPTVNARSSEEANNLRKLLGHNEKPLRQVA